MRHSRFNKTRRLATESLEARLVLSSDGGILGLDARLSLSFVPDGTIAAGEPSELFVQMDSLAPRHEWQAAIVKGFQQWAVETNGDVGIVADDGSPFGTAGRISHDPRFGDIRIGSVPLDDQLYAVSVSANEAIDGTWTGDVLFNSNANLNDLDEVFAIALHEAGHVFGIEHSDDKSSPMFGHGIPQSTTPTLDDLEQLHNVFGVRSHDVFDLEENGNAPSIELDHFKLLENGKGTAPTVVFGDITNHEDSDTYSLDIFDGYTGSVTFELVTSQISQLSPQIDIESPSGFSFVDTSLTSGVDGRFTINNVTSSDEFEVRIEAGESGSFGIGGYSLIVWFDDLNLASQDAVYKLARLPFRHVEQDDLEEFFEDGESLFVNDDAGQNNQPGSESEFKEAPGFVDGTRYLEYASIEESGDVDRYYAETPEEEGLIEPGNDMARISLTSVEAGIFFPELEITDSMYNPVDVEVVVNSNGVTIVQFGPIAVNEVYFATVASDPTSVSQIGNYELDVVFGVAPIERDDFFAGQLGSQNDSERFILRLRRPQLFHFSLEVGSSTSPDSILRLRVVDMAGNELAQITTAAGQVGTTAVFLPNRKYRLIVDAVSGTFNGLDYSVAGDAIDDPLGPIAVDSTVSPFDLDEERIAIHLASLFGH